MANEQSVVARIRVWFEGAWQDVIYGCRMLVANPGFTSVAILSLAVGIGANGAIFSFADALLLRPLPVVRPGELLTIGSKQAVEAFGASGMSSSYRDYVDLRERTKSFASIAAFTYVTSGVTADPKVLPRLRMGMVVSDNFFSVMGVQPDRGRIFRPEEQAVPGRDAVVVLSHSLWEREFGADQSVLGRTVLIRGIEFTIVGVAPEQFTGLNPVVRADFFVPLMMWPRLVGTPQFQPLEARGARQLNLKGRLNPGVSMQAAQTELTVIARDLERAYPDTNKNRGLTVRTELQARMDSDPPDATLIAMLTTLALAVLLVACANVAGLMTSRSPARAKEMALRLAIGAGRARLVRQLLTESVLIALGGGVLGLAVGYAGMMLFRQIDIPTELPIRLAFEMDRRALLVSLAVSVVSAVLFGVVPAIQAARTDLNAVMKASESTAPGKRRRWGRTVTRRRSGGHLGHPAHPRHLYVRWVSRAADCGAGVSHRSPAHHAVRSKPGGLLGGAVTAVFPEACRWRTCRSGGPANRAHELDSDAQRHTRHVGGRPGGLPVSSRQGQCERVLRIDRRALLRRDGNRTAFGPQFP